LRRPTGGGEPADDERDPRNKTAATPPPLEHRQRVRALRTVLKAQREVDEWQAAFVLDPKPDDDGKSELKFVANFDLDDEDNEESVLGARISKGWGDYSDSGGLTAYSSLYTSAAEEEGVKEVPYEVGDKVEVTPLEEHMACEHTKTMKKRANEAKHEAKKAAVAHALGTLALANATLSRTRLPHGRAADGSGAAGAKSVGINGTAVAPIGGPGAAIAAAGGLGGGASYNAKPLDSLPKKKAEITAKHVVSPGHYSYSVKYGEREKVLREHIDVCEDEDDWAKTAGMLAMEVAPMMAATATMSTIASLPLRTTAADGVGGGGDGEAGTNDSASDADDDDDARPSHAGGYSTAGEPEMLDGRFSARVVGFTDERATLGIALMGGMGGGRAAQVGSHDGVSRRAHVAFSEQHN